MSTTWILVANASIAKLYANHGAKKGLELVKEFSHPESREKASTLVSDRPGHNPGAGNGHGSFVPASSPKEVEANRFAHELAQEVEHGRVQNIYDRLILVASAPFLGLLNSEFTQQVKHKLSDVVEKDYTKYTPKEISEQLAHCIYL